MLLGLLAAATGAIAQDAQPPQATDAGQVEAGQVDAEQAKAEQFVQSLHLRSGDIAVPEADAHFRLGPAYRYLDKPDARRVLEQFWGNPADDSVLGMVVPAATPLSDAHSWAVVVTRADEGHVSDEDAAKTDYAKLLKQMQEGTRDENAERKKLGYPELALIGWAVPPRYDAASKKLYWARELAATGADQHTLNYDIRVLGRSGYVSLNAIASMQDIATVQAGMQQLLPMVEFDAGHRYADYDSKTDKLAAYGVAALIGGGIAAKAGLFAKLGVLLLAGKKLVVLLLAGIAGLWRKFAGKGKTGVVR